MVSLPSPRVLPRLAGLLAAFVLLATGFSLLPRGEDAHAQAALPPLPSRWPSGSLQLGLSSSPNGTAAMKAITPYGFRYQYLAGGVNTGNGWATWNTNGQFVTYYIQESRDAGITPVFTYYMIYQSSPGGSTEPGAVYNNLNNTSTMQAYFNDLKLFYQRAGAFPDTTVLLHAEPDMWGYMQQRATSDDATSVSVKVAATGMPELQGLPNSVAGLAQAFLKLRDLYAPNVVVAYHVSIWGTNTDITYQNSTDAEIDQLAARSAVFYRSLGANFDLLFGEFSDRDAAFKVSIYGQSPSNAWWDSADFDRHIRFFRSLVGAVQKRLVLWQIPQGNTRMRALNNQWNHFQDNTVETLLDDPARTRLQQYRDAGVLAFLFGRGADGATCACDANGDGVTNPAPINGNTLDSLSADDDGGFFVQKAKAYYGAGPLSLPGGSTPPTPTSTSATSPTATPTPTSTTVPTAGWTTTASASPSIVAAGGATSLTASVTSGSVTQALVDLEIYSPGGAKVFQRFWDNQTFAAGQTQTYTATWSVPASTAAGTYTLKVGVFSVGWGTQYDWNNAAGQVTVTTAQATATPPPADTTPPTISNVRVSSLSRTGATVSWTTDEASDSRVEYGLTAAYGSSTSKSSRTRSHSVSLSGLAKNTLYHFRVSSRDAAGNVSVSGDFIFTTKR